MLLNQMRKHSRSFIIYIFFGIIIAVFVVNFGPQSAGCTASTTYASKVEGTTISPADFAYAISASNIMRRLQDVPESLLFTVKGQMMDQILVRELLADDALDLGFRVSDKEIDDKVVKGAFLNLGKTEFLPKSDEGNFEYDLLQRYLKGRFGITVKRFKQLQRREYLADKVKQLYRASIKVSADEVKADYLHENTKVQLDYVRFVPGAYRDQVSITAAKLKDYIAKNKTKIAGYYNANKNRFNKLPKQVRLQLIRLKVADQADKDAVKLKADELLKQLKGGADFDKLARAQSQDSGSKQSGGLISWRNADNPGLGDAANKAVAPLKKGQLSGVVQDKDSLVIYKLVGTRKGNLSLNQAQEEIAEEMLKDAEAVSQAQLAAKAYLKQLGSGKFADFFPSGDDAGDKDADKDEGLTLDGGLDKDDDESPADKAKKARPKRLTTTFFARSGRYHVPGIGVSRSLTDAAFLLKKGQPAKEAFVVGQQVYLVAVADRQDANLGEWTKERDDLVERYLDRKASAALRQHVYKRCRKAVEDKQITVNQQFLLTRGFRPTKDKPLPQYVPCASLKGGGR